MGWIQFATRYDQVGDITHESTTVDVRKSNTPFFAEGYPPELYDAPCNNLNNSDKLRWVAHTFLTTIPSRMNNDTVSFLAGFEWGYEEFDIDGIREVTILPVKVIDGRGWNKHIELLKTDFPSLCYAEYTGE